MRKRTVALLVLFVILTWAGSAGIAYGVVELTGGGSQGEQGPPGPQGEQGPRAVATGIDFTAVELFSLQQSVFRLAELFAVVQVREGGEHPQTQACIDYILDNEGSFVECGFTRSE